VGTLFYEVDMKKFDSILFDLDGTLASTVDCCV